jgi:hypothetical protein
VTGQWIPRTLSVCLALALLGPWAMAFPCGQDKASSPPPTAAPGEQSAGTASHPDDAQLPDSPPLGQQPAVPQQQPQTWPQEPVGTAAAGMVSPAGIAASRPAGAAIAPAKQRRVRTILISVGAVLGAGVAVGTVAALSSASPSRPPGSH